MKKAFPEEAIANTLENYSYHVGQGTTPRIDASLSPGRSAWKKGLNNGSLVLVDFVSFCFDAKPAVHLTGDLDRA
jgi:hypothetical protein